MGEVVSADLGVGGRARHATVRLPDAVGDGTPLLLVLHGNHPDATGAVMRQTTTFDAQADRLGWAAAYPDGYQGCWADGRGVTAADEAGVDDVAFLRALVDWSATRYGTVTDRVVVAGISNGAFLAHRFALEASDHVAVLAAVAGGLPAALADRTPECAVSALLIHGTADRVSPIEGGWSRHRGPHGELRGRTLSLGATADRWRAIDRCPPGPGDTVETAESRRTTVSGGYGGTRVAAWTVLGGGHTWPGTPPTPGWSEPVCREFDAAEEICRFAGPLLTPAGTRRLRP
ncbi:alpha/beta hydrolase family esterase [Actinocatenispora rupis]|uniref:Polyhydroxybutyrate depolymerase n=1 Tax=Actinocatenispora rupis TaxID=519421 RepID=A0A8J3J871_9ACTN|nr:PHB depolymerase family esterase [Actinocatenispora rupis]GID11904.1 hypothetical protein Aru02nite_27930 [Actinocatenispora rupis]